MSTLDQPTVREEHQEAECEHAIWLEDIGRWRSEHRCAAALLAQAQAALLEQDAALESPRRNRSQSRVACAAARAGSCLAGTGCERGSR